MRQIVKAEVVPWEIDEGLYGVAYTTNEGWEGADLQEIADQKVIAFGATPQRADG